MVNGPCDRSAGEVGAWPPRLGRPAARGGEQATRGVRATREVDPGGGREPAEGRGEAGRGGGATGDRGRTATGRPRHHHRGERPLFYIRNIVALLWHWPVYQQ